MESAKHDRSGKDQISARRAVLARCATLSLGHLFEYASARGDVRLAYLGQGELAGRTQEQLRIEVRFELRDLAAHGGKWHAQLATCFRKAARLNDRHEYRHRLQLIHNYSAI